MVAWCHSFCLFWYLFSTYIHSITFIRRHSPRFLSISSSLVSSVGKTSLWCPAENQTRACRTASRRTTNWATPHPDWATPHPDWATPHPLSYAAPFEKIYKKDTCQRPPGVPGCWPRLAPPSWCWWWCQPFLPALQTRTEKHLWRIVKLNSCSLVSSDFPRLLFFVWFWFGLEIQRLQ